MKNYYKGLLIKRQKNTNKLLFQRVEIDRKKSLDLLYMFLECETIDIQERYINNKIYDFIIDDEFLLNGKSEKKENIIAVGNKNNKILEAIFYSLLIVGKADENGKETDLTESDIDNILNSLVYVENQTTKEKYQVINYTFEEKKGI